MAIKITRIRPKPMSDQSDRILAHLFIEDFEWINEESQQSGMSTRALMFDWIVNKKGKAYIKKGNKNIPIFGANSPSGQYIRSIEDGKWTNELLELPEIPK